MRSLSESKSMNRPSLLIFTDLDGTLLDGQTYDFSPALPALNLIRSLKIPLILVSSKTRAEIEDLRKRLSLKDPFIAENGGGVFFPGAFALPENQDYRQVRGYKLVLAGRPIDEVLGKAALLKKEYEYTGFSEMSARAIAAQTGLSLREAGLAARREFDEPIVLKNPGHRGRFCKKANDLGLECVEGGRFIHLFIGGDKGKAVQIILGVYTRLWGGVFSIGLGDSPNDFSMLDVVDKPVLMRQRDGTYTGDLAHSKYLMADGFGPEAWNRTVLSLIADFFPGLSASDP
jgi:mannosyl-3-phosphoglycerate phosphatase family protein